MNRLDRRLLISAALLLLLLGGVAWAGPQHDHDHDHGHGHAHGEGGEGHGEMQADAGTEAMMAQGAPGEHHKHLAAMVGDWTYEMKMWMPGSSEPSALSGTMHAESILGGRFVREEWSGSFMGQPFTGIGIDGYDNAKGMYTSTWRDNMGTYTLHYTGSCESSGKVRNTTGTFTDPMSGQEVTDIGKVTHNDDGTVLMESWRVLPGGEKAKSMEILLTRK